MKVYSLLFSVAVIAGCSESSPPHQPVGMANPASVYCEQLGGRLEMQRSDTGTSGYCVQPSGKRMEEWALYRRDHPTKQDSKP